MQGRTRSGALSLGIALIRRQLATQPAVAFSIFVAALVSVFLVAAAPRLLETVSSDDAAATVSQPPPAHRNITVERLGRLGAGPTDDPLQRVRSFGEQFVSREMPASVQAVISDDYFLFTTPQFRLEPIFGEDPPHPFPTFIRFRYQERVGDEITIVSGAFPRRRDPITMLVGAACPSAPELRDEVFDTLTESGETLTDPEGNVLDCAIQDVPHYEIAVSAQTAEAMGLEIGQLMVIRPDPTDTLFFGLSRDELDYQLLISISGIVELSDSDLEYWYGDADLHRPRIRENPDFRIIFAIGLIEPDTYGELVRDMGLANLRYNYRQFVTSELIKDADLDTLIADLRDVENRYTGIAALPRDPRVTTQLSDLLREHLAQRQETISVMSTIVSSLFTVAIAVVMLLAVLMASKQRRALLLTRNRGASGGQLTLTQLYLGLLIVVPPSVLGYLIAELMFPDTDHLVPYRTTVALVAGSIVVIVAAVWPLLARPLGNLQRALPATNVGSMRRVVFEISVVLLALGSVALLRRRGQIDGGSELGSFDWLLAATPGLISIAVGIVAIRLFPLVMIALAWAASRMKGLTGYIGFKRLLDPSVANRLPLLVILVCVAAAVFASVARSSVDDGQQASSYQAVGADFTVKGHSSLANVPASVDLSLVDSIEASASGTTFDRARLARETTDISTEVLALDTVGYQAVTTGTLGDVELPTFLTSPSRAGQGSQEVPIPAIVSDDWPADFAPAVGDVLTLELGRLRPVIEVREIRSRFPDIAADRPFVVFNRDPLIAMSDFPVPPTVEYLRAPESTTDELSATIEARWQGAVLTSRYEFVEALTDDPFVRSVDSGILAVFAFATALAIIAAISAFALASSSRRTDIGYLSTLGLNRRQATALSVIEQLPIALAATVVGALTGVGTAMILDPAIALDAFTGNIVPTAVVVNWQAIAVLAAALFAALTLAIIIFVAVNRSQDLGQTLKVGDE